MWGLCGESVHLEALSNRFVLTSGLPLLRYCRNSPHRIQSLYEQPGSQLLNVGISHSECVSTTVVERTDPFMNSVKHFAGLQGWRPSAPSLFLVLNAKHYKIDGFRFEILYLNL